MMDESEIVEQIVEQIEAKEVRIDELENEISGLYGDIADLEQQLRNVEPDREEDEPGMGEWDITGAGDQD